MVKNKKAKMNAKAYFRREDLQLKNTLQRRK